MFRVELESSIFLSLQSLNLCLLKIGLVTRDDCSTLGRIFKES